MKATTNYLEYLDEDFNLVNKVFKANLVKRIFTKVKANVKDNKVNVPALKTALKPLPVLTQDKINKFLDRYVPNYTANYNTAKKHFDKKFPTRKDNDVTAGMIAAGTSLDKKKTLQDNIKRADRLYSSNLGTSSAGGLIVVFGIGMIVTATAWNTPELFDSIATQALAVFVGILLMMSVVANAFK